MVYDGVGDGDEVDIVIRWCLLLLSGGAGCAGSLLLVVKK